jgi:hypothetical protein
MHAALSPAERRGCEERIVRESWDQLVQAGMDASTMPFQLYFLRYQMLGALQTVIIVAVLETLMADGKDDGYLVAMVYTRLRAWFADHGDAVANWRKSIRMRKELLLAG